MSEKNNDVENNVQEAVMGVTENGNTITIVQHKPKTNGVAEFFNKKPVKIAAGVVVGVGAIIGTFALGKHFGKKKHTTVSDDQDYDYDDYNAEYDDIDDYDDYDESDDVEEETTEE